MCKLNLNLENNFSSLQGIIPISIICSLFLFYSSSAIALKNDIEQPVHINAGSVVFNKSKGLASYEGNVSIAQGSLKILASKIKIDAPNNDIKKIMATGSPVSFQQKMDDGKMAKGSANSVVYLPKKKQLILDGNAVISQDKDKFSSNHIVYSISTGELKAGNKKSEGKGRVNVIFYPSNKAN